jgi:hypothetical protein
LFFSRIIDRYALYTLHRTRSKEFQYTPLPGEIPETTEREEIYKVCPVFLDLHYSKKDYNLGKFKFESLVPTGDPSNDHIEGEVICPWLANGFIKSS